LVKTAFCSNHCSSEGILRCCKKQACHNCNNNINSIISGAANVNAAATAAKKIRETAKIELLNLKNPTNLPPKGSPLGRIKKRRTHAHRFCLADSWRLTTGD
jgi:hypothetical protein